MFRKHIESKLKKVLKLKEIELEIPSDPEMGDYAFPCFLLAKTLKKAPPAIAEDIVSQIKPDSKISKVEAKGPYANFFINKSIFVQKTVDKVLSESETYGSSNIGKGKKYLVEHTSINPNASPHMGRARNAMIGDTIVRLLRFQNFKVDVHYLVNDIGKQISLLVLSCADKSDISFEDLLDLYINAHKKMKEDPNFEKEALELLYKLEKGDKEVIARFKKVVKICIDGQKDILGKLDIHYNHFDFESDYIFGNKIEPIMAKLSKSASFFKDSDGRFVLNQEEFVHEMRKPYLILTRNDGTSLYVLRDLAYTIEKMHKSSNNLVILGEDQKLYFKQLSNALHILGKKAPKVVHYSFVLLKSGKMSTRKGEVVLLSDFMDEAVQKSAQEIAKRGISSAKNAQMIGYGALKYSILKISSDKNVIFDWESALNFEGDSAPYIQYAYARAMSIINKAQVDIKGADLSLLNSQSDFNLTRMISKFPDILKKYYDEMKPHILTNYVFELAKQFTEFYHSEKCITDDKEHTKAKMALVVATKTVIKNGLYILGIDSPNQM